MATMLVCVIIVLTCFVRTVCTAPCRSHSAPPSPKPTPTVKWYASRYFFFSNEAPMNKVLRNVDGFVENADKALDKLSMVEASILNRLSQRVSSKSKATSRRLELCNLQDDAWKSAAIDQVELRFPVKATMDCVTDFIPQQRDQNELHHIIYQFNKMLEENAVSIAREAGTNFTDADTIFDFPYNTASQRCRVNALGAYRVSTRWYLNIGITNEKKEKHLGEFERQYLVEVMGRFGASGHMTLPVRPPDGVQEEKREFRSDSTTAMVSHRSTAEPAFFKAVFLDENVAVVRAVNSLEKHMQQVNDALSASSMTILLFPLWLNLVPIALLADVSTVKMLVYSLLSDVLTALPLAIKGIELIWIGSQGRVGTVVRMSSGLNGTMSTTAAAEVYVAECFAKSGVLAKGAVFVAIAMVFLIGGVSAEFAAKRYRERVRRRMILNARGRKKRRPLSWSGRWSDSQSSSGFIGTSLSLVEEGNKAFYYDEDDGHEL
eukprot:TRINITY_DN318_c0_g1_i1.p2 TRINITY_DN318_c0_g1~~TRINITY_DN318_c0_g1_i1.p2  ORF type:complete len:490 (-),score=78.51 TRINITY_DN318_c0_g1_i1:1802-3271(-)